MGQSFCHPLLRRPLLEGTSGQYFMLSSMPPETLGLSTQAAPLLRITSAIHSHDTGQSKRVAPMVAPPRPTSPSQPSSGSPKAPPERGKTSPRAQDAKDSCSQVTNK